MSHPLLLPPWLPWWSHPLTATPRLPCQFHPACCHPHGFPEQDSHSSCGPAFSKPWASSPLAGADKCHGPTHTCLSEEGLPRRDSQGMALLGVCGTGTQSRRFSLERLGVCACALSVVVVGGSHGTPEAACLLCLLFAPEWEPQGSRVGGPAPRGAVHRLL